MPKITVIIPNYNHAAYLSERIQSVFKQTYQDFEVLLLDDCSTDQSREIFSQYSGDPRVEIILNDTNSGSTFKQWNKGVQNAKGEYIWFAESDDFADPRLLEKLMDAVERNPNIGLAYCQSWIVDHQSTIIKPGQTMTQAFDPNHWQQDFCSNGREECLKYMTAGNIIPNASAVLIKREIYNQVGGADETMKLAGDWLLWTKILMVSDLAFVAEPLNYFRVHGSTVRKKSEKNGLYVEEACKIIVFIEHQFKVSSKVASKINQQMLNIWSDWIIKQRGLVSWQRNVRIYQVVSQGCPNVAMKLIMTLSSDLLSRILKSFQKPLQNYPRLRGT